MIVLHFIFIVHHINASVEFLQLNSAHNDNIYVTGRTQVRILEDKQLLAIWQLWTDIIQSSQSWLWPSTMQWSKQGLMWPEKRKQNHHQYWFWDKKWNNCHIFQDHLEGIRMVREGWKSRIHTWYLSFFLHWQNFWRIKFTPKKRVNYDKIHRKLPIFCVITAKYTVNCQFFALNL